MILRTFDVVALDDNCTRFAAQREVDDGVFETIGDFSSEEAAQEECDFLNQFVERDSEALEAEMALVYGPANGGQQ